METLISAIMTGNFVVDAKAAIEAKGWTQEELADKIPVSPNAVSLWFNERRRPSIAKGRRVCQLLDLRVDAYTGQFAKPGDRRTTPVRLTELNRLGKQTTSAVGSSKEETPAQSEQGEDALKMEEDVWRYLRALDEGDRPKAIAFLKEYVGRRLRGQPADLVPLETAKEGKAKA